ncbi:FAD-dependent oxidoreductase [Wenyingzhuangia aestuarii]|uniref:FAD-dependent oxidoreductase n=1 Tax=Wenyingzhuangia aestuarii TaxID=1647582 RepID=UPI00143A440C|nr:NAD(P)/FAD-dependent oxidoreductase [Wenyingzhuangia aestuarii]NJB82690.1 2-polyprenyl-6-methoxyphenol hydroxylase-like FAD-dependent oxidoreductase [Wenyingzhuangia aestuarii]
MNKQLKKEEHWTVCLECNGLGKKKRRIRKKVRLQYQLALEQFHNSNQEGVAPIPPKASLYVCPNCKGAGVVPATNFPVVAPQNYPHIAIVGGGIGGVALAVACLHRGIPFTLYERDPSFDARSQGYGLTLQQASKAIEGFGLFYLDDGVVSTRHLVHTTEGKVIGEWGMRKWMESDVKTSPKRTNIHIPRQSLRLALLKQLKEHDRVQWGHQFIHLKEHEEGVDLTFEVNGELKKTTADLVVGADGIRSAVRKLLIGEEKTPLRYLGCIVILGICPLEALKNVESTLLDAATVFQTANGTERIYMMPYTSDTIMWQLSFPMLEQEAKELSAQGVVALKQEACRRTQWHHPIPQILEATQESQISGYPVYDRELLQPEWLTHGKNITLIGDAAHPMSPFKGQGANQALLDALSLARNISKGCRPKSEWRKQGIRKSVLNEFELEMIERSAVKVKDSAAAANFLHSEEVLYKGDQPRGRHLK